MTFAPEHLLPHLPTPATSDLPWVVGFSGGLDSMVLLHALWRLNLPVKLQALHINHQISPNAAAWQACCERFCAARQIPFQAEKVVVVNRGRGIEDAARAARYDVFAAQLTMGGNLLTAHHANDQAETLLLRLMRGTGPRGLAAMAMARPLGKGQLIRPLLKFTRADLEAYARAEQLQWVEDESNSDDHYDRNFLRNQVMPLLQARWPDFESRWQQTAELCAVNEQLLDEIAQEDLALLEWRPERLGSSIRVDIWRELSRARQRQLLRYWLRQEGLATPEQQHWQQLDRQLAEINPESSIDIRWGNVSLRHYRQRLFALPLAAVLALEAFSKAKATGAQLPRVPWDFTASRLLQLALGQLAMTAAEPAASQCLAVPKGSVYVGFREGGERAKPSGRGHSQTLKKLLQEYGLEPWLRDSVPLVYAGDTLIAVGDLWVCDGWQPEAGQSAMVLRWTLSVAE